MPYSRQRPLPPHLLAWLLVLGCLFWSPASAWAKGCAESEKYPADSTPEVLWGELQPERILADATRWTGSQLPSLAYPVTTSIDFENGYAFQSFYGGFSVWDARTSPGNPTRLSSIGGWEGQFPSWPRLTEFTQIVFYIDVPEGNDSLAAVSAITPVGFTIWDTSSKTAPRALYQDTSKFSYQVYAARIGGRDYAFVGDFQSDNGLHVYDMTQAKSNLGPTSAACVENRAAGESNCQGVYRTRIGAQGAVKYVAGLQVGSRHFIARSGGYLGVRGVQIWEVTNPISPSLVVDDFKGDFIHGLAMWTQGSRHYLAFRQSGDAKIADVTDCLANGCQNLSSAVIWQQQSLRPYPESLFWLSTTFSRSGSTPFLYFGNHETCRQGKAEGKTEYLYDVTNAAAPREITPAGTTTHAGETVDYWSWYYSTWNKGYAHFGPRGGKFHEGYFYRAAATLFDVHKWNSSVGGPPVANFTYSPAPPDKIYENDTVTFTSTTIGSAPTLAWVFGGGTPPSGSATSVPVTFSTKGSKTVTLTASNTHGTGAPKSETITVHQVSPGVGSVGVSPANAKVCQPITLTAEGLEGKPPLDVQWQVLNGAQQSVATGSGNPFTWNSQGQPAGTYTANVAVKKTSYADATASSPVVLGALAALPGPQTFAPTNLPFSAGTVTFSVNVAGATEWKWDFGDGTVTNWLTDPISGPTVSHSYTSIGQKTVRVWVRNCAEGGPDGVESSPLTINVTQVAPLKINNFQAACQIFCDFNPTQAVQFDVQVEGDPTEFQYDWDGNGSYEQVSATKITSHTYAARDTPYFPVLRLKRGVELSEPFTHGVPINVRPAGNPSVTVSGPSSGQVGQSYSFSANGVNCTPGATWTWSASGGTVTGNGANVTIVWSSPGNKSVSASSGNCGTGSATININQGGGSVNGPATGQVGQSLTFTATGCTGGSWAWSATNGGTVTGSGNSVQISWSSAGAKTVTASMGSCAGSKNVTISDNPGGMRAEFSFLPTNPGAGQAVAFNGSASTGNPAVYFWEFGDGTTGDGVNTTHAFATGGQYNVKLTVYKDCAGGICASQASTTKTVSVTTGPQFFASYSTNANCFADNFGERCEAEVGTAISFTSTSVGATTWSWAFGDGGTATGPNATHTFVAPGAYQVQLTISNGQNSLSASRLFVVTGEPIPQVKEMILPWIAKTVDGALVQSSDLYLHNPGPASIDVTLEFRRRGLPEDQPPKATRTIAPNATLFVADVVKGMFGSENLSGFVAVKIDKGNSQPVVTSFNTTFTNDGSEFGQTVPGYLLSNTGAASTAGNKQIQHLVGLNDNNDRFAYFGLSNPGGTPVTYSLRFFDSQGNAIGTGSQPITLSRYGAKQYQVKDVRTLFGISDKDDYRMVVESDKGTPLFPYAANLRIGSNDPSYVSVGTGAERVYLLGALSTPGLNNSVWRSDVVIANTGNQVVIADLTFTNVGATSAATDVVKETLQPGETRRLEDVIGTKWNIRNGVGVLTIDSDAPGSLFPAIQGESYENTNPAKRYGQTLPGLTDQQAAGANQGQYLVGLRQDTKYRTTFWIFNPGSQHGVYDVVFRALDGHELSRLSNVGLGAGKLRQFNQSQFPAGVEAGFTVQVLVKSGKVLAAGQVVNNRTNDPAYIQGETR